MRPAVSCTRGGADWPKVVAVGAQQPISDFLGFIQMRDTLSTNGEHLRVAEVKSFPAISKSMRSVNGDQNGANLKKVVSLAGSHHTLSELFSQACQNFSASKIFVKLLFIWAGLDVFPFKMMKKEACRRAQHGEISRN